MRELKAIFPVIDLPTSRSGDNDELGAKSHKCGVALRTKKNLINKYYIIQLCYKYDI